MEQLTVKKFIEELSKFNPDAVITDDNFNDILKPSFGWCKYMEGESSGERDIDREKREATHISIHFSKYDDELDRFVASEKIEK